MAKTYAQFLSQIEALRAKADAVRRKEAASQIKRVRDLISLYGLTADDLGLSSGASGAGTSPASAAPRKARRSTSAAVSTPKYHDDAGHSWTGRGPRPGWLKAALASGRSIEDFAATVAPSASDDAPAAAPTQKSTGRKRGSAKAAKAAKAIVPNVKFRLGDQSWSGRGPQPRWLKDAIDGGKSLDELRA